MRVFASDSDGNTISLIYFNNPGWAKRSLPIGQNAHRLGQARSLWRRMADHPSRSSRAGEGTGAGAARAGLSADRGAFQPAPGRACRALRSSARPSWPNGSSRASPRAKAGAGGAHRWARRTASPAPSRRAGASPMTRFSPTSSRSCCCASRQRRKRTIPLGGTGELIGKLQLPYQLTGAQRRVAEEIRGDMAQNVPMLRLLQGDVGSGKTLVAVLAMLVGGRVGRPGGVPRPDRDPRAPASCDAARPARQPWRARRDPHRPREGQGAGVGAARPRRRLDRHPRRHARDLPGEGRLQEARPVGDRRAAPVRSVAAAAACGEGRAAAASAGDDRDPDPAHADADPIWRDGRQPDRRDAAGPVAGRNPGDQRREIGRCDRRARAAHQRAAGQAYWVCPLVEESEKSDAAAAEERARVLKLRFGEDKVGLVHGAHEGPRQGFGDGALRFAASSRCWSRPR